MSRLEGRTALVTGSGRNIGRGDRPEAGSARAPTWWSTPAQTARRPKPWPRRSALSESRPCQCLADVADREQVAGDVRCGPRSGSATVDVLVSNAAIRPHKPFTELTLDDWERVRGVVLDGAFHCARNAIPAMQANGFGRIVFLTGDGAWNGSAERSHVSAAKMGVVGLARGLASEFAPHNVRVNGWCRRAASTPAATSHGIPARTRPMRRRFPWAGWDTSTTSPGRWYSWPPTTAASSRGRRST